MIGDGVEMVVARKESKGLVINILNQKGEIGDV